MNGFMTALQAYLITQQINYPDNTNRILEMLFDAYNESSGFNNSQQIRLRGAIPVHERLAAAEKDDIIYAVCALCRAHEMAGFVAGIKIGL